MTERVTPERTDAHRSSESYDVRNEAPPSKHGWLIGFIVLLIVAAVVIMGIVPRIRAKAALRIETHDLAIPTVKVIHPKRGAPQQEIVLPGNIQAFEDAPIYARTNGYLKKWYADIGAHVRAGQLLAEIDTPEVDQQLAQARAQLNTAQANYHLAEITATRYQELKSTDSVSTQDVDNAVGAYQAQKANVASADSNVKRLEETQSFKMIYAPFDGVITARNTDVGQLIDSGANGGSGNGGAPISNSGNVRELFHIASTKRLRVYVYVPQQYSQSAKPGLSADLTLAEFPGRRFQGKLVRTANAINATTRTLLVEVDVDNPAGELLPGAYTEVHLKMPNGVSSYILPVSALIFRSEGLQIATVDKDNKINLSSVTLGRDFGAEVEVISGLNDQDQIVMQPPDSLIVGESVNIAPADAPAGGGQGTKPGGSAR
jgi:multidrug efflux pump subunit AcrA (membrane-fusion protein)